MKNPVTIIFNDTHITPENADQVKDIVRQIIKYANSKEIESAFLLGDVFEERQKQPLASLKCFEQVLDLFNNARIKLFVIPGNHDKTNYESEDSFLDSFSWHPSLKLVRTSHCLTIDGVNIRLIPFFKEKQWLEYYKESLGEGVKSNEVLMSHIAVKGSVNNDGKKVDNNIPPVLLKKHTVTLLGHYHNCHKVSDEIYHIPSIKQKNFGENNNKGFTVLYNDYSFEIIQTKSKGYKVIDIDLGEISEKEFNEIIETTDVKGSNVRLRITGSEDKLKPIKVNELKSLGFDVKKGHKDITQSIISANAGEFVEFTDTSIVDEFKKFCEEEQYEDPEVGMHYITKKLKK